MDPDAVIARVNQYREAAGLRPVAWDDTLTDGAQLHADYLLRNNQSGHEEDPSLPGYTQQGDRSGRASDIAFVSPLDAVDSWMASLYHRVPILRPGLQRIGMGYAGGNGSHYSVLDVVSGLGPGGSVQFVRYPPEDGEGIPLQFGGESPDPIPTGAPRPGGYPVTIQFEDGITVTGVSAGLRRGTEEVACHVSTPEAPATSWEQDNTVCLIPRDPLAADTEYAVRIEARVGGRPQVFEWRFRTRGR